MESISTSRLFRTGLQLLYAAHRQGGRQTAANLETATSPKLRRALKAGIAVDARQQKRLEEVFKIVGLTSDEQHSEAMQGISDENNALAAEAGSAPERDLIFISYGQVAAHYYLAQYGTMRAYSKALGHRKAAGLLDKTLKEISKVDTLFTGLAERVRKEARKSGGAEQGTSGGAEYGRSGSGMGATVRTAGLLSLAAAAALIAQSGAGSASTSTRF